MKNFIQYIKRVLFIVSEAKAKLILILLLFLLTLILDLLGIGMVAPYIAILSDPSYSNIYLDRLQITFGAESLVLITSVIFALIFTLKSILVVFANKKLIEFGYFNGVRIRLLLMKSYQLMPYLSFTKRNSSEYIYHIENLAGSFAQGTLITLIRVISEIVISLSILFFLIWSVGYLVIFAIVFFGTVVYAYLSFFKNRLMEYGRLTNSHSTTMVQTINEGMSGLKELRILGKEEYFLSILEKEAQGYATSRIKSSIISIIPRYLLELLLVLSVVIMVVVSDFSGDSLEGIVPVLSTLAVASLRLFPSLNQIVNGVSKIRYSHNTVKLLYNDLKDLAQYRGQQNTHIKTPIEKFKSLELKNISFTYNNKIKSIINNISIRINAGDVIGFVGSTGSGKTTLINIILGLIDPTKGSILVNEETSHCLTKILSGHVAYLPQKVFLIDDTLKKNIALGENIDEIDLVKLNLAIKNACLSEVVKSLPEGVDTNIGESGVRLSGGQQQRIALARAFYYSRSILVMDESTSALDQETENEIIDEIEKNRVDTTIIVIAHRLTTLKYCDVIYRLDKGVIIERGNYKDLIHTEG